MAARNREKTSVSVRELQRLGGSAAGISTDVADEASVAAMAKAAADEFGRIDILVNNAGIGIRKAPQDYTADEWRKVVDVNLTGSFLCAREVYPHMVEAGAGKIINIGSMTSIFGSEWVAAYSASKGAVVQLTKSLAIAWAKDHIQVNVILPGWIHTDLTAPIKSDFPEPVRVHTRAHSSGPVGRAGGDGGHRGLPGQRCLRLRHRSCNPSRRRLHLVLTRLRRGSRGHDLGSRRVATSSDPHPSLRVRT